MKTFETPEPISVTVDVGVGELHITAGDRTDTVVEVRPGNPSRKGDVAAAEQTRVDFAGGTLSVRGPKGGWRQWTPRGGGDAIDVSIELPAGSRISGDAGVGSLWCSGRVGDLRFRTGFGNIQVEHAGAIDLKTGFGDIGVERADGMAEVRSGSGSVAIGTVDGAAAIRDGNGSISVGTVTGDARIHTANGGISLDVAGATVAAKTANGPVRIGEVSRGAVVAQSAAGAVEVGVREGVAAWLDLRTRFGRVRNDLDTADQPPSGEETVEVHAHTSAGDITIRRAVPSGSGSGKDARDDRAGA